VLRRGVREPIRFRIVRDKIPIYSIDATYMADAHTGYIRVSRFGATTSDEFKEALATLKKEGMKNLILDLEGNGGGYLNAAIDMANEFLHAGELIVYTEGRTQPREEALSNAKGQMTDGRLIVLVDESSASASEIVSGAIQDLDRGLIVGRRTFGKGLVQRPVPLPDGSMMRLTVARYYTPSGRCIQKPYADGIESYNRDLINRYNSGELTSADNIHFPDSLRYRTAGGRTVYGGGGIMPDYFVPLDTTRYTDAHRNIVAKGVLNQYVVGYFDKNQKVLKVKYPNFDAFEKGFTVTDAMMNDLRAAAEKDSIKIDAEQYAKSAPLIKTQIKALVARDLFTTSDYFRVINNASDSYRKALELINDEKAYRKLLERK
jgi:carboxyl-terminal processing protease